MPIKKPEEEDTTQKEPDGELDFDLNKLQNLGYYCFGCLFLKSDNSIDYAKLKSDIEIFSESIAKMSFDAGDISDCIISLPKDSRDGTWILECRDYDFTEEDCERLKKTKEFQEFVSVLVKKVQAAFAALSIIDEKELENVGISKEEIDKISSSSLRIMTVLKSAVAKKKISVKEIKA